MPTPSCPSTLPIQILLVFEQDFKEQEIQYFLKIALIIFVIIKYYKTWEDNCPDEYRWVGGPKMGKVREANVYVEVRMAQEIRRT